VGVLPTARAEGAVTAFVVAGLRAALFTGFTDWEVDVLPVAIGDTAASGAAQQGDEESRSRVGEP
jgi:hypothetical protein